MPDSSKQEGMDIKFTILSVIVLVLTTYILILVFNKILTKGENCKYEEPLYNNLQNIDGNTDATAKLREFYIKTAYNCCSVSDKWVNICALNYTIREGCRCLDFEIFDVNGEPVIGTTLAQNGTEKDSYNHLPLSDVLETINEIKNGDQKVFTIVGCGGNRDKTKRPEMAKIAVNNSDKVILTSDNPRHEDPEAIIADMEKGVEPVNSKKTLAITNRKEAIKAAVSQAQPDDIILIAGKGHETYQLIGDKVLDFNDMEILTEYLKQFAS